jgi:microcystin-dependent protein
MSVKVGVASLEAVLDTIVPVGTVIAFAGVSVPDGWLLCNGAAISRSVYTRLFTAIDIAHGYGDNSTTFNLPDLRGRFLRGVDGAAGNDPDAAGRTFGAIGGNTGDNVGSVQGDDNKAHTHKSIANNYNRYYTLGAGGNGVAWNSVAGDPGSTQSTGGSESRPKNVNVNYLIRI